VRYLLIVRTAVSVFAGFLLVVFAILCATGQGIPADADPATWNGRLIGAILFTFVFGVVGYRITTRRTLPPKSP
jgi:hypothetical protein